MAAGTATPYNKIKVETLEGNIQFGSGGDSFKVALMSDTYTPDIDNDDFWSDISAHEAAGAGYVAGGQALANQVVTRDDAGDRAFFDADNPSWAGITITVRWAVIYKDTGVPATSPLVGYIDFGGNQSAVATTFLIQFNSSGILEN